jgi:ATP-dependent helicase/nuclease subunit A
VLEARLRQQPVFVPPKIRSRIDDEKALGGLMSCAEEMADSFLASTLGKRWAVSTHHETEFSVVTSITMNTIEEKAMAVTGQMDLLFEEGGEVVVVDFKTDRVENPADHYGQLAIYRQAAADIFGKPVSVWLFYLRSGRAVDVTESTAGISLGELRAESDG